MTARLMVVDDDPALCDLIRDALGPRGFEVTTFTAAQEAFSAVDTQDPAVLVTDLSMPGLGGIELCQLLADERPDLPVIVLTAFGSLETATQAIRAGAYDFVTKPVEMDLLVIAIERAMRHRRLQSKVDQLGQEVERARGLGGLIGESEPMLRLMEQIERVADTDATILVSGESGTGKELVARALHQQSHRKEGPLVTINCAALTETLLESELFGHVKGAYTGAQSARKGLFARADGGTIYLDEVGEIPVALQPKLLRALEEGRVRPVGSDREVPFDARIVSATNRDLQGSVEGGSFREDLYYRLNVIEIRVPALRARGNDVLLLARHFLSEFSRPLDKPVTGLSEGAAEKLLRYDWPGNVRELRNAMERAVALSRNPRVGARDLPERIRRHTEPRWLQPVDGPNELVPLEDVEKRYILHVLKLQGGNKTLAARTLGLDRKTLYRKLRSYEEGSEPGRVVDP